MSERQLHKIDSFSTDTLPSHLNSVVDTHARTHARKLTAVPINHCSAPSLPVTDGLTHICLLWDHFCLFSYDTEPTLKCLRLHSFCNTLQWAKYT